MIKNLTTGDPLHLMCSDLKPHLNFMVSVTNPKVILQGQTKVMCICCYRKSLAKDALTVKKRKVYMKDCSYLLDLLGKIPDSMHILTPKLNCKIRLLELPQNIKNIIRDPASSFDIKDADDVLRVGLSYPREGKKL